MMNRREAMATMASLFIPTIVEAKEEPTKSFFYSHKQLIKFLKNAKSHTEWDFAASMGDTIKEKYETLYFSLVQLTADVRMKSPIRQKEHLESDVTASWWVVTTPEISSIFETATIGFAPRYRLDEAKPAGVIYAGTINCRWRLFKDDDFPNGKMLIGFGMPPKKITGENCGVIHVTNFI
jgi:hypothetical protein